MSECMEEKVKYSPVIRPVPFRQQKQEQKPLISEERLQPSSPNLQTKSMNIGVARSESAFQVIAKKPVNSVVDEKPLGDTLSSVTISSPSLPKINNSTTMVGIQRFFQTNTNEDKKDSEYTISMPEDRKQPMAVVKPLLIDFPGWKKPQIDLKIEAGDSGIDSWLSNSSLTSTVSSVSSTPSVLGDESSANKTGAAAEEDDNSDYTEHGKRKRNKEASRQYREKRKMAIKDVFNKQRDLEKRNKELQDQLAKMQEASEYMQKLFAAEINTKEKIKGEIVKLISRSSEKERSIVEEEVSVMQKIFQHVADDKLTKGCVENAIYEIWGEVLKGEN